MTHPDTHACCHHDTDENAAASSKTTWGLAARATLHCLTGCAIGETLGMLIGVSIGLPLWPLIVLDFAMAFLVGVSLSVLPLIKEAGLSLKQAIGVIWLGEVVSITVMEIAMNTMDYHVGGMTVNSILHPMFWLGLLAAIPAGYIAALPVNYWLLSRAIKKPCH